MKIHSVIISRTDAIGDVVLTLPMAKILKTFLGGVRIIFFGKTYTQPIIDCANSVDEFINYDSFSILDEKGKVEFLKSINADGIIHVFPRQDISAAAKLAGIKLRIGTTGRLHHWFNCNRLVRLTRKNSDLHEAQLNLKLLKPFGFNIPLTLDEITSNYDLKINYQLPAEISSLLNYNKTRIILHPKSNASGREWSLNNYEELIRTLSPEKYQVIITGAAKEAELLNEWHKTLPSHVLNLAGKLSLPELIALIESCNGIIAAGTGPLHIGAAAGIHALGIFPPIKPIDPDRWAPVGVNAEYMVLEKNCSECRFKPETCHCINEIRAEDVLMSINEWDNS